MQNFIKIFFVLYFVFSPFLLFSNSISSNSVSSISNTAFDVEIDSKEVNVELQIMGEHQIENIVHKMTLLIFQIALIVFAAKLGGFLFSKIRLPQVLGELVVGIIIGPYLLGGISLPGFEHGLFPLAQGFAVSPELYGIATLASILLLFIAGLETDLHLLLRYSVAGSLVGFGGVLVSFIVGDLIGVYYFDSFFMNPKCLFMGVISTATSVGISARILSEKRKMDSPEGVTILAGAVIDDVIGIILLAIVMGIASSSDSESTLNWAEIGWITVKAVVVWLGVTAIGVILAKRIGRSLKKIKKITSMAVMALALAMLLGVFFEKAGLAMIIGAYVMGLILSNTDLSYVIQDKLRSLEMLLVPLFFTVMGMLVNITSLLSYDVFVLGIIFSVAGILTKIVGAYFPSILLNFNRTGAWRVAIGMVPRGEVALIIAGIGLQSGILDDKIFGITVMLTLITAVISPPLLSSSLANGRSGVKKDLKTGNRVNTDFTFESMELTNFIINKIIEYFRGGGFFVSRIESVSTTYYLRKDNLFITMIRNNELITFDTEVSDISYIKTIVYESLLDVRMILEKVSSTVKPEEMKKELIYSSGTTTSSRLSVKFSTILKKENIIMDLKATTKDEVFVELIECLSENGELIDKEVALNGIRERESSMSTGMSNGMALPHSKTAGVDKMTAIVGFSKKGVEFESLDGLPSKLFILMLSPLDGSGKHIQLLVEIGNLFSEAASIEKLLNMKSKVDILDFFKS